MVKTIVPVSKWKPVAIEGALLLEGALEGLGGIEEISEYKIENDGKTLSLKDRKKQRKLDQVNEGPPEKRAKVGQYVLSPQHQQQKKKKKKRKKSKQANKTKSGEGETKVGADNTLSIQENSSAVGNTCQNNVPEDIESDDCQEDVPPNVESDSAQKDVSQDMSGWNNLFIMPCILKALTDLNFQGPTHIQALTLPPGIKGRRDILGAAETGSGKTLAFGIPILQGIIHLREKEADANSTESEQPSGSHVTSDKEEHLSESDEESDMAETFGPNCVKVIDNIELDDVHKPYVPHKRLWALILTPTRELAIQVKNHLAAAAKYTDIKVATVVGGMSQEKQERILRKGPEIVVATPGRLWELIKLGNAHLSQVKNIKYLAIDEADRMVERGHFEELQSIMELINSDEENKKQRQNFVFSATLTFVHDPPDYIKKKVKRNFRLTPGKKLQGVIDMIGITNHKVVDITQKLGTVETLTESRINCTLEDKDIYLYYFLLHHRGRTLVFCNSIDCVRRLQQVFSILQCNPFPLHAQMHQRQRLKNLERFSSSENGLLLASDVAARGLDIPNIEHVIHYQVPRTSEGYVHRSGRTARAQNEGLTLLLIEPKEVALYSKLLRSLDRDKDIPEYPVDRNVFPDIKKRVKLAREIDRLELSTRKVKAEVSWFQKAAKDMDLLLDADELPHFDQQEEVNKKKLIAVKKQQLKSLLSVPLCAQDFSGKYPTSTGKLKMPTFIGAEKIKAVDLVKASKDNRKIGKYRNVTFKAKKARISGQ